MSGLFDDILAGDQTLIENENALEFEFLPKILPHRDNETKFLASCILPLFHDRMGKNVLINGAPGIGKTAATKHVLREMQDADEGEEIRLKARDIMKRTQKEMNRMQKSQEYDSLLYI